MKTLLMLILALLFMTNVKGQIFHENFENPDSVISSSGSSQWVLNSRIAASGMQCDSASISLPGDSAILTTISFSTIGLNNVYLYFNQICKIEFFDSGIIEVSTDGGTTWMKLIDNMGGPNHNCDYLAHGHFVSQGAKFSEASYSQWFPGQNVTPEFSMWKREIFDVTTLLANQPDVKIRFVLLDGNNTGGAGRAGWFIDDILVDSTLNSNLYSFANRITGEVFADLNSNLIKDPFEPSMPHVKLNQLNSSNYTFGYYNGGYILLTQQTDTVKIAIDSTLYLNNYFSSVPIIQSVYFPGLGLIDSLNNFALQPIGIQNDLKISISGSQVWPRNNTTFRLNLSNVGNTTLNPVVKLNFDSLMNYVSSPNPPTLVSGDSIIWNLGPLMPFQNAILIAVLNLPANVNNVNINNIASIEPLLGDANLNNNFDTSTVFINPLIPPGISYDPNNILVDRDSITTQELQTIQYLDYIINFQNTGTAAASYVRIDNLITGKLDLETIEIVAHSHPMNLLYNSLSNTRKISFEFNNINLPDSTSNEPGSHGYVRYRMKPYTNLVGGDSIPNSAEIFFDWNAPITTNTAITRIVSPTSLSETSENYDSFLVYPTRCLNS